MLARRVAKRPSAATVGVRGKSARRGRRGRFRRRCQTNPNAACPCRL